MVFKYRGKTPVKKVSQRDDIQCMIVDWHSGDEPEHLKQGMNYPPKNEEEWETFWEEYNEDTDKDEDRSEFEYEEYQNKKLQYVYVIRCFGLTERGETVGITIKNFQPYFYIKPNRKHANWNLKKNRDAVETWFKKIVERVPYMYKEKVQYTNMRTDLVSIVWEQKREFIGFNNEEKDWFIQVKMKNMKSMKKLASFLEENPCQVVSSINKVPLQFEVYESNIEPFLRFIHERNLQPAGWIQINRKTYTATTHPIKNGWTRCQIDIETTWTNVHPLEGAISSTIAPLLIGAFDLECTSTDGSFPDATRPEDKIIQIGFTLTKYPEKEACYRWIGVLGESLPIEGVIVENCETETELLLAFRRILLNTDVDILTGYNIWGFDMLYMVKRAELLEIPAEFWDMGRIRGRNAYYEKKELSSSALGDNSLHIITMHGRVVYDLMKAVQKDHKLDMYKLDFVAEHFIGSHKVDLTPQELFQKYKSGTPKELREIAVYCVQDCFLCNQLSNKLEIIANNIGMANVCLVPFSWLFLRGQGVKIFSLVAKKCRDEGICIPVIRQGKYWVKKGYPAFLEQSSYEGAIVLVATPGIYMDPIAVMDYGSLYPSSMIAENISHDSLVFFEIYSGDNTKLYEWGKREYYGLENYKYNRIEYDNIVETNGKKVKDGKTVCYYAEKKDGTKGIIPNILQGLLKARKTTRKLIELKVITLQGVPPNTMTITGWVKETETAYEITEHKSNKVGTYENDQVITIEDAYNDFQKNVLDGLQLAYKITCNSVYGQVGARTSPISFKELAASTTATGREQLKIARDFTEQEYKGAKVVYGDSVSGDTPLILRNIETGEVCIETIETLSTEWVPYEDFKPWDTDRKEKQQASVKKYQIWAKNKWADIHRVIRHKTTKRMFRVFTHNGVVDVSEDHSLLNVEGNIVKPCELKIGETKLMTGFPDTFNEQPIYTQTVKINYDNDNTQKICNKCNISRNCSDFYKVSNYNNRNTSGKREIVCKYCRKKNSLEKKGIYFDTNKSFEKKIHYSYEDNILNIEEAYVWGFFMGDGSCGKYNTKHGIKYTWALNNQNITLLNKLLEYLSKIESIEFTVLDTMKSSNVYKIVPLKNIKYMVCKYRDLFYDKDKYKKVPNLIFNASYEIKKSFLQGYYDADGAKTGRNSFEKNISFECKGKIGAHGLYYLFKSIGYINMTVNTHIGKENIYRIQNSKKLKKNPYTVKKIEELPPVHENEYIYDIETSDGIFNAGVGEIVVKNTDSCFVSFMPYIKAEEKKDLHGKDAVRRCIELGIEVADRITNERLKRPQVLEYEKTFYPFIQLSKKRYVGNLYEFNPDKYKLKSMGIVLKRRDNANIVKKIYGGIINCILEKQNLQMAFDFFKQEVSELLTVHDSTVVNMQDFVITKTLRGHYKNRMGIAHAVLADRMGERDAGSRPQVNDRIPFIYIDMGKPNKEDKILQGDRIETPDWILKHPEIHIDYFFYWEHQIQTPTAQLLALALEDVPNYNHSVFQSKVRKIQEKYKKDITKQEDKIQELREKEVIDLLCGHIIQKYKQDRNKMWEKQLWDNGKTSSKGQLSLARFLSKSTLEEVQDKIWIRAESEQHTTNNAKSAKSAKERIESIKRRNRKEKKTEQEQEQTAKKPRNTKTIKVVKKIDI